MLSFPFAKINLGLHVLGQRPDGYRSMETVMLPISVNDVLEVIRDPSVPPGNVVMERSGCPVPGDPQQDLCVKAVLALNAIQPLPGLRIHVLKNIPIGAGLGGGSSDAAHTLLLLNSLFQMGLREDQLHALASAIGSDCPFFLHKGAQLATGRGELLSPISVDLKGWWLLLINPGVHVSTAEVYANTPQAPAHCDLRRVLTEPPTTWNGRVVNVMEPYVMRTYPAVAIAKQRMIDAGAVYAAMSGSGSSVFGLFAEKPELPVLPEGQRGWVLSC
jgi:4-diphosphocytidyl-2-C-methyl-D-erythritol kinase